MKNILIFTIILSISYANVSYDEQIKVIDDCLYLTESVSLSPNVKAILFEDIDAKKSIQACKKSLSKNPNDPHILFLLARAYTKDSAYKKGFEMAVNSCSQGDTAGCTLLGGYYYQGLYKAQNTKKAFLLYLSSCIKNDPVACTNLAQMKENNDTYTKASTTLASDLLLEVCVGGNYPHGCEVYGNYIYFKKIPYSQDRYEYSNYKACISGIEGACSLLRGLYREYKVPQKEEKIDYALKLSCQNGNLKACERMRD